SPEELWKLLLEKRHAITRLPKSRWTWPCNIDAQGKHQGIDFGGFLDDITRFDSRFFRISPREAELMDPQQRLLLQVTWSCLEDAGYPGWNLAGSKTGVFIGASGSDYRMRLSEQLDDIDAHFHQGSSMAILPNRISYFYDWNGPSILIDTACSSSL